MQIRLLCEKSLVTTDTQVEQVQFGNFVKFLKMLEQPVNFDIDFPIFLKGYRHRSALI